MDVQGWLEKLNQQVGSKLRVGPRSSGFQPHLISLKELSGPNFWGEGWGTRMAGRLRKGSKRRTAERPERHTEQMKQSERIRNAMGYNREREKRKTEDQVCGLKKTESRKSKNKKKLAQRNKDEETMTSRKDRTGKIA